ncbi:MAG TPA: aminotransferase class I/II-fold pyridoxal phosphate-dependent enzyme [Actinophytocola sp.]|uniref:pyridoxal phosphate-dependent decarboxylase family protein n=1 Tax=Actinophytocola sp. TaxID=1872138 RepID=UPI002DDDB425|nr:aminotransferase class I/II-fold pyridoxal phosphate-dependent enzyme [Actinophytocola sp.]HEV2783134.1 aminotransferase class I/II-fold pyridoxal phosphate-dependent enzyme [Actinophytocola sp.]
MNPLDDWLRRGVAAVGAWQSGFGGYREHPAQHVDPERFAAAFTEFTDRLGDNFPYFHPDYVGQMLKPPHPVAVAGYLTAMLINPNNHAADSSPATSAMEREAIARLAAMFGFDTHLGHLTSSGTIANLEALYVARESHPGKGIAFSADSHYTHGRMCHVLGMPGTTVPVDGRGRMDLDALERVLAGGTVGTVVLTAGTTGLGAIDPIHEALALKERYGVRLHVDAAYGGFFSLLAQESSPERIDPAPWRAIARCDSVVIDPHKHGLQPYGCGAVLFADPSIARFYLHDSPYTYFTDAEFHLGEISLECSRAGAAAAALWLTLRVLPLTPDGLGRFLVASRRAALAWARTIADSPHLELYQEPELDIVTYFPAAATLSAVDAASAAVLAGGMKAASDPVFVSALKVDAAAFARRHPRVPADADGARVLRSVLIKPEAETHLDRLRRIEHLAARAG